MKPEPDLHTSSSSDQKVTTPIGSGSAKLVIMIFPYRYLYAPDYFFLFVKIPLCHTFLELVIKRLLPTGGLEP